MLLIDDALLLRVVAQTSSDELLDAADRGRLFTTGSWYYRLASSEAVGVDRCPDLRRSPPTRSPRSRALAALDQLPDHIGLLDFRTVVPTMVALDIGRQLNLLAAEALAAALLPDADVFVTTDAPLIRQGAAHLGLTYRVTGT